MRYTCKKLSANVLLLVAIAVGQNLLTDNLKVLENDNDTVMVKIHYKYFF